MTKTSMQHHHSQSIKMSTRLFETIASLHEAQVVDLKRANIDDEGAVALADALKANTSGTEIDISENQISDVGASALADALKRTSP
jgi:Ran GTPase-activating protein (RanGAP) involved in mRNA processing and transport